MFLNSLSFQNDNKVKKKPMPAVVDGGLDAGDHSPGFARGLGEDMPSPPAGSTPSPQPGGVAAPCLLQLCLA